MLPALLLAALAAFSCQSFGISVEECYTIGMAYFELGKYEEAERWLSRAGSAGRTRAASEYNLGRIAFETGRYGEAADHFGRVLEQDQDNVMALRALAYTRIKTGEKEEAAALYRRVLALVPDSADDGYNHALVLYALENYTEAEELLLSRQYILAQNKDMLLLLARTQRALGKVEAADSYAQWLVDGKDSRVRYEYARTLEDAELYAKALEEYQTALTDLPPDSKNPGAADLRFSMARVYLVADADNPQGMIELKNALDAGFAGREEMETLAEDQRIPGTVREEIRQLTGGLPSEAPESAESSASPESSGASEFPKVVE
ncbi:MAG: tetratricopeptide repeat protein [Treponema sp.]|jgi:tetratricopeptide (TPR) repeat protein|nr:tetratricopeptide repeat protein [Treponema sp.]